MKHYDDSELIEVHFLPGENTEAQSHLAACADCAARMTAVAASLRAHAGRPGRAADAKPQFFWERQSVEIRRRIAHERASHHFGRLISVAAMLVLLVGASFLVIHRQSGIVPTAPAIVATTTASVAASAASTQDDLGLEELQNDHDAWSTDPLKPYHGAVEWESWLSRDQSSSEGKS